MASNKENTINSAIGQIVAYYPFRYKTKNEKDSIFEGVLINGDGRGLIESTKIENDKINYDTYVKIVDSSINAKNNNENKYCRSLYSVGLIDSEKDKQKFKKTFNFDLKTKNNKTNKNVSDFVDVIKNTINTAREKLKGADRISSSINSDYYVSKLNVILYPETRIGFVEIFVDYAFKEKADPEKMAYCMNVDGGALKKLLFVNTNADDSKTEETRIDALKKTYNKNSEAFIRFVSNIKENIEEDDGICLSDDDIMFNCKKYKKRAYAFSYLAIKNDLYKKYELEKPKNKKKLNTILHYLGRCHGDSSTRAFNTSDIARFLHTDDTFCTWSITKVSFGTLFVYDSDNVFKYTTRALDEQHVFLYEMCLHLRFYLYSVIEEYRKPQTYNTYYKLKANYADIMTRYNLSMVSEVETQELYEIIRDRFDIDKIVADANESLERVLIADQSKKATKQRYLTTMISLLGAVVGIKSMIPDFFDSNTIQIVLFGVAIVLAILTIINIAVESSFTGKKNK